MVLDDQEVARLARCLNGVPVLGCAWGSEAARVGLRRGDVVVAVNGIKTPTELAFNYARSMRSDRLDLEVVRDGDTLTIFVPARNFDPMMLLDDVVASRFEARF